MRGDDAYAVLGLRPGAERAEIDQAYRRLIKRYHPDSAGGDASRAADLNRAYSELRARTREAPRAATPPPAGGVHAQLYARPPSRWRVGVLLAAAVLILAVAAQTAILTQSGRSWRQLSSAGPSSAIAESRAVRPARGSFSLDEPLATALVDTSVDDALRLHAEQDPALAAGFSRNCLSRLGANPSIQLFDACAAYDEAIAILAVGNSEFESGPFNPSAVTARQVGAARLLSADYFEAESRLQRIRSRVHMVLLPKISDRGRVSQARAPDPEPVRVPDIAEMPELSQAFPPTAEPRGAMTRTDSRTRVARGPAPQPRQLARAPARQIRTVAVPSPPPAPARAAAPRRAPAWQQPIKPVWQQPLAPATD